MVKGIVSQQCQLDVRLPITMDILIKMLHALPLVHINPHEVCMYRAVLVTGFYCLMCPGELTESQHVLFVQGVQLQSHRVLLMLNSSKANKSHNLEVITLLAQEHSPCPVKLIWDYAKIRPWVLGQFFLWSDNSPLQYSDSASYYLCISTISGAASPIFQTTWSENWGHNAVAPDRGLL